MLTRLPRPIAGAVDLCHFPRRLPWRDGLRLHRLITNRNEERHDLAVADPSTATCVAFRVERAFVRDHAEQQGLSLAPSGEVLHLVCPGDHMAPRRFAGLDSASVAVRVSSAVQWHDFMLIGVDFYRA